MATFDARLACESLEKIREVLLIGLASYGEIERLSDAQQIEELCGNEIREGLRVIHPTGSAETVGDLAALFNVDQIRDWTEAAQARAPEKADPLPPSPRRRGYPSFERHHGPPAPRRATPPRGGR
jgi:hypothetical protein